MSAEKESDHFIEGATRNDCEGLSVKTIDSGKYCP